MSIALRLEVLLPRAFPRGVNDLFGLAAKLDGHLPVASRTCWQ